MSFTLVTGGAKNLGKEICLAIANAKGNVAVHYHKSKIEAEKVAEECRSFGVQAKTIQGDFSSNSTLETFFDHYKSTFPSTKNIVNNVGNYAIMPALKTPLNAMQNLFQTNLFAPFYLIQSLVALVKQEKGSIVNIGATGLSTNAENYSTAYSMTKLSLLLLTTTLAKDLGCFDVAVNMVSPGILEGSVGNFKDLNLIPMKRFGTAKEVAKVVVFLLDQNNHYITGQNIEVAGGVRL
jgi:NAD(P)-dependent dehydrogenase (short-subunit alcohol dehydrogenase family)